MPPAVLLMCCKQTLLCAVVHNSTALPAHCVWRPMSTDRTRTAPLTSRPVSVEVSSTQALHQWAAAPPRRVPNPLQAAERVAWLFVTAGPHWCCFLGKDSAPAVVRSAAFIAYRGPGLLSVREETWSTVHAVHKCGRAGARTHVRPFGAGEACQRLSELHGPLLPPPARHPHSHARPK